MSTELTTQRAATGLALATFDDAFRFAKMVAASEFAPKDFKGKAESCLLAIQHGSEVGLSPMQSLQSIAVINGRPTIWGDAALALVQSSPVCEYVREYVEGDGDAMVAVCEAKRKGYPQPTVVRFGMADAKRAGLLGKAGPWSQYPARMLALRARGFALRNAFADALRGLITAEEAQDYPQPEPPKSTVKSSTDAGNGITVHHVTQFTPPQETRIGRAKLEIGKATTLDRLGVLRRTVAERGQSGDFTADEVAELTDLITHKAEMLIGEDEKGQEFTHEAAEHEVTA